MGAGVPPSWESEGRVGASSPSLGVVLGGVVVPSPVGVAGLASSVKGGMIQNSIFGGVDGDGLARVAGVRGSGGRAIGDADEAVGAGLDQAVGDGFFGGDEVFVGEAEEGFDGVFDANRSLLRYEPGLGQGDTSDAAEDPFPFLVFYKDDPDVLQVVFEVGPGVCQGGDLDFLPVDSQGDDVGRAQGFQGQALGVVEPLAEVVPLVFGELLGVVAAHSAEGLSLAVGLPELGDSPAAGGEENEGVPVVAVPASAALADCEDARPRLLLRCRGHRRRRGPGAGGGG